MDREVYGMKRPVQDLRLRWLTLAIALLLFVSPLGVAQLSPGASAQQKTGAMDTAKQSEKLQKKADAVRASLHETSDDLEEAMGLYNSIMSGKESKPRNAHKKLVSLLDGVLQRQEASAAKWGDMEGTSEKFFKGWEEEIDKYQDETLKTAGQERLDAAKARYAKLSDALTGAKDTYGRFLTNFKEQAIFMGRDLSPEALASLQAPATKLNEDYNTLKMKAEEMRGVMDQNRVALTGQASK